MTLVQRGRLDFTCLSGTARAPYLLQLPTLANHRRYGAPAVPHSSKEEVPPPSKKQYLRPLGGTAPPPYHTPARKKYHPPARNSIFAK